MADIGFQKTSFEKTSKLGRKKCSSYIRCLLVEDDTVDADATVPISTCDQPDERPFPHTIYPTHSSTLYLFHESKDYNCIALLPSTVRMTALLRHQWRILKTLMLQVESNAFQKPPYTTLMVLGSIMNLSPYCVVAFTNSNATTPPLTIFFSLDTCLTLKGRKF